MQFFGAPFSAFSLFLPLGQIQWHYKSFKAPYKPSLFLPPTGQALATSKETSVSNYWNTKWSKVDFCYLFSAHLRLLGKRKIVKIWLTVPHSCVNNIINAPELPGVCPRYPIGMVPLFPIGGHCENSPHLDGPLATVKFPQYCSAPVPHTALRFVNRRLRLYHLKRESVFHVSHSWFGTLAHTYKQCMCRSTLYFNI